MAEGETSASAPSLEQILWRAMDRFREEPALVDAEEFAQHIARAFDAEVPEETFADRFFDGAEKLHRRTTFAAAVVRASQRRMHVYEFDLGRLEYVIVEDDRDVVVVSEFGQFRVEYDDALGRALEAAVVTRPERAAAEPRAYFVRASGEVVGVEVAKVARTLERLKLRQVSMPPVLAAEKRLVSFDPVRREMSEARERRALEQRVELPGPGTALWDGQATIGSGTRWEQMLGASADAPDRRVVVETGNVVAIVAAGPRRFAGERALAGGEMLAAVRAGDAPVQALGSERTAAAFAPGSPVAPDAQPDGFWVQPETAFVAEPALPERTFVARPLQLGQITGDPWADWALTSGEASQPAPHVSADALRHPVAPASPALRRERSLEDAAVVAFRAPDGRLVVNRSPSPFPLATLDRPGALVAWRESGGDLVPRAGALPIVALRALHMALERTAAAGGYRLPAARIHQVRDAIGTGRSLALPPQDPRRRSVRLAAPLTAFDHAARLLVSIPFPNRGQLHVGEDLSEALHAYLAAPVTPLVDRAFPSLALPGFAPGARLVQSKAVRSASEAARTLELPAVTPLLAVSPSISDLPALLRRALAGSGNWTAGPGAPLPLAVREVVERSPFSAAGDAPAPFARRPPGPGEEEIVIPLPLWAQMGRGAITETDVLLPPSGGASVHAPPLGAYRLVSPGGGAVDLTAGAPARTGVGVELSAPSAVRISRQPAGRVTATTLGKYVVGRLPLDEAESPAGARRTVRGGDSGEGGVRGELVAAGPDLAPRAATSSAFEAESLAGPDFPSPARTAPLTAGAAGPLQTATAPLAVGSAAPAPRPSAAGPVARATEKEAARTATGLPPGSWDVQRRIDARGSQPRAYAARRGDRPRDEGAILVTRPAGAAPRRVPVSLRFRYVEAPLWWSTGHAAQVQEDLSPEAFRAARAGLGAANTAAALWRSILVAGAGQPERETAMTSAPVQSLEATFGSPGRLDGLGAMAPVPAPAVAAAGPAFIAVSSAGAAGAVPAASATSAASAARARAQAIEMSIVAAIPPAPPPLSTMSSAIAGPAAPLARGRGAGQEAAGRQKEAEDVVSHSKIEGSVDAIAQRIYHRIRRRLQSDRERFGG